jgi:hypothetical protein
MQGHPRRSRWKESNCTPPAARTALGWWPLLRTSPPPPPPQPPRTAGKDAWRLGGGRGGEEGMSPNAKIAQTKDTRIIAHNNSTRPLFLDARPLLTKEHTLRRAIDGRHRNGRPDNEKKRNHHRPNPTPLPAANARPARGTGRPRPVERGVECRHIPLRLSVVARPDSAKPSLAQGADPAEGPQANGADGRRRSHRRDEMGTIQRLPLDKEMLLRSRRRRAPGCVDGAKGGGLSP